MKGLTYISKRGFSINEGEFPNIHVSWGRVKGIYIAIKIRGKAYRFSKWYGQWD